MNSNLIAFSDELVNVVEAAEHGVVRINARRRLPSSGVVWGADGAILTAEHALEFEEGITVGLPDGHELNAVVAGRDPGSDLALLRVDATGLSPLNHAEPTQMKVGTLVLALGRPYGNGATASVGIISQRTGPWRTWRGGVLDSLLLSDVAMYPGFSGSALVDAAGRLIGLNTSLLVRGVAAAIPAQTLAKVAEMLATHGRVRRGYLGVSSHPVPLPEDLAKRHSLQQESALMIVGVEPGSPAEGAGFVLGDVLVSLAGHQVGDGDELQGLLGPDRVGQEVVAMVLRGGELKDLRVTIGERR